MNIPMFKPYNSPELESVVIDVIRSGRHIGGKEVKSFEEEFASYIGVEHAVTANSATSAEMLALIALGLKCGDEVLVPSHTMFATAEQIFQLGARPVFVDIDETFNISPDDLESRITDRCIGILPVHFAGQPCNMREIMRIAEYNKLWVLEDCAQAHGAMYKNKKVGSFGIAGTFSFFPSKNLGTIGDGGIVTTNDEQLASKVRMLRDHGRRDRYTHDYVGFNLRFDPIKAAVCRLKLKLLDDFNEQRRVNAGYYDGLLMDTGIPLPLELTCGYHVYHLYVILLKDCNVRDQLKAYLKEHGIETNIHYPVPCHLQPITLARIGYGRSLPKTEDVANRTLSLPMYPGLKKSEIEYICKHIHSFLQK